MTPQRAKILEPQWVSGGISPARKKEIEVSRSVDKVRPFRYSSLVIKRRQTENIKGYATT
jgi:hypothetical protein